MMNNQGNDDLRNKRAFENATWILTDKKTGKVSEYDYSRMSKRVIDAYISHNNQDFPCKNVSVKYLQKAGCEIYRIDDQRSESVTYSTILPEYSVECYGWYYQCNKCNCPSDKINVKGKKGPNQIFCMHCKKLVKPR